MDRERYLSMPLTKVAPRFYKEKTYWETQLTRDELFRDIGSVDHMDYNPFDLDEILVTSLARVSVYDTNTLDIKRTFKTSTQYQVYGGVFRKTDGRLVAAASEEGKAFIFEAHNTTPLRTFDVKAPTHRVLFYENQLVTFSDDLAVRLFDIGTGTAIKTYGSPEDRKADKSSYHNDYVRCGSIVNRLIVSGSYDGTVKLWDPRTDGLKPTVNFDHGHAVESLCTRGDTLLLSVGGNKLHIFDLVAGKTLTNIIPRHHKTITCVANHEDKYVLTGALDGYLNVLNFNYEFVTRFNYDEAQILSLSVNPKLLAVGFNNHHVCVKRFKEYIKKSNNEMAELEKLQSGYFGPNMVTRYFHEAIAEHQDPAVTHRAMLAIKQKKTPIVLNDVESLYMPVVIPKPRRVDLSKRPTYEKLFMGFHHSKALDAALVNHRKDSEGLIYVLHELMKRDKLKTALTKTNKLITLMRFIGENLSDIRHNRVLLDTALALIGVIMKDKKAVDQTVSEYAPSLSIFSTGVEKELRIIDSCATVAAQLNTIVEHY